MGQPPKKKAGHPICRDNVIDDFRHNIKRAFIYVCCIRLHVAVHTFILISALGYDLTKKGDKNIVRHGDIKALCLATF